MRERGGGRAGEMEEIDEREMCGLCYMDWVVE